MAKVETEIIMPEIAIGDDFGQAMELAKRAAASKDAQWAQLRLSKTVYWR